MQVKPSPFRDRKRLSEVALEKAYDKEAHDRLESGEMSTRELAEMYRLADHAEDRGERFPYHAAIRDERIRHQTAAREHDAANQRRYAEEESTKHRARETSKQGLQERGKKNVTYENSYQEYTATKEAGKEKYGCLMAVVPESLGRRIMDWARDNIPEHCIASGGYEIDPHVTILHGFTSDDSETIRRLQSYFARQQPFEVKVVGISKFDEGDDGSPLILKVQSDDLRALNKLCKLEFDHVDKYPTYKPHLTIAYVDPEHVDTYARLDPPFVGEKFTVSHVVFATESRLKTVIGLGDAVGVEGEKGHYVNSHQPGIGIRRIPSNEGGYVYSVEGRDAEGNLTRRSVLENARDAEEHAAVVRTQSGYVEGHWVGRPNVGTPYKSLVRPSPFRNRKALIQVHQDEQGQHYASFHLNPHNYSPGRHPLAPMDDTTISYRHPNEEGAARDAENLRLFYGGTARHAESSEVRYTTPPKDTRHAIERASRHGDEVAKRALDDYDEEHKALSAYDSTLGGSLVPPPAMGGVKPSPFKKRRTKAFDGDDPKVALVARAPVQRGGQFPSEVPQQTHPRLLPPRVEASPFRGPMPAQKQKLTKVQQRLLFLRGGQTGVDGKYATAL